jgi:hypothetical protein
MATEVSFISAQRHESDAVTASWLNIGLTGFFHQRTKARIRRVQSIVSNGISFYSNKNQNFSRNTILRDFGPLLGAAADLISPGYSPTSKY